MINRKAFFTFLPGIYCFGMVIALLLRFFGEHYLIASNLLLNIGCCLIFVKLGIILHETGHLLFARAAGGTPKRMILGNGQEISRFEIFHTKVVLNKPFRGGLAFVNFEPSPYLKLQYFMFLSGGILTNFLFAFTLYTLTGFNLGFLSGRYGIDPASAFIATNLFLCLETLLPLKGNYMGLKFSTDGLNILKIPFGNIQTIKVDLEADELLDAFEHAKNKEYDKAIGIYRSYLAKGGEQIIVDINLSTLYLKKGEFETAMDLLKNAGVKLEVKRNKPFGGLYYNNLAWLYLIEQDIEKADLFSKLAIDLNPKEKDFWGTRGAALIEKGNILEGMALLQDTDDPEIASMPSLSCSIYLLYGYTLDRNIVEQHRYMKFIERHKAELELDEKRLYEIVMKKMGK